MLEGVAQRCTAGYAAAVEPLKLALKTVACDQEEDTRSRLLACLVAADLWDDDTWHELTDAQLHLTRRAGARTLLPYVLTHRALMEIHSGRFEYRTVSGGRGDVDRRGRRHTTVLARGFAAGSMARSRGIGCAGARTGRSRRRGEHGTLRRGCAEQRARRLRRSRCRDPRGARARCPRTAGMVARRARRRRSPVRRPRHGNGRPRSLVGARVPDGYGLGIGSRGAVAGSAAGRPNRRRSLPGGDRPAGAVADQDAAGQSTAAVRRMVA